METVLIIDDSAFMRMLIKRMLENNGLRIIGEAENGKVGVDLFRELQPDLVTMDITMPVLDGIQALKNILELDPHASVVMISAMGQETLVKEAVLAGAKGFLVKPLKPETIATILNKVL